MPEPDVARYPWCRSNSGGGVLILTLHIQPGAKRTETVGSHGDALKIRLSAPPVEGAANAALLEFLAETFDVPRRQVTVRQGLRSRRKVVEIRQPLRGPDALCKKTID